jgi:hypothetical protein
MGLLGTLIKNGPAIIKVIEAVGDILDDGKRNKSYHYESDDDDDEYNDEYDDYEEV